MYNYRCPILDRGPILCDSDVRFYNVHDRGPILGRGPKSDRGPNPKSFKIFPNSCTIQG